MHVCEKPLSKKLWRRFVVMCNVKKKFCYESNETHWLKLYYLKANKLLKAKKIISGCSFDDFWSTCLFICKYYFLYFNSSTEELRWNVRKYTHVDIFIEFQRNVVSHWEYEIYCYLDPRGLLG